MPAWVFPQPERRHVYFAFVPVPGSADMRDFPCYSQSVFRMRQPCQTMPDCRAVSAAESPVWHLADFGHWLYSAAVCDGWQPDPVRVCCTMDFSQAVRHGLYRFCCARSDLPWSVAGDLLFCRSHCFFVCCRNRARFHFRMHLFVSDSVCFSWVLCPPVPDDGGHDGFRLWDTLP